MKCKVPVCERDATTKTKPGYCSGHKTRVFRGDPINTPLQKRGVETDVSNATYRGMHKHIIRVNGPASEMSCIKCGSPAEEWAYLHNDPEEVFDEIGRAYSRNIECYEAMCVSCHRRFDRVK